MSADDASPTGNVPAQCYDEKNWEETNALNNKTHHRRFDAVRARARHLAGGGAGYPDHPVKIVVPFAPAGPTDVMARLIAQKLSDSLKQQFLHREPPGSRRQYRDDAGREVSAGWLHHPRRELELRVNPSLYAKNPYDPFKDFAPVTLAAASPNILVVHSDFPAKSVKELVDLIKKNPANTTMRDAGTARRRISPANCSSSPSTSTLRRCRSMAPAPRFSRRVAGHTPIAFTALPPTAPQVQGENCVGLRSPRPTFLRPADVPTMAEAGVSGQESETMQGILVPAGTPKEIVDLLNREIVKAMALPDVKEKCAQLLALTRSPTSQMNLPPTSRRKSKSGARKSGRQDPANPVSAV